MTDTSDAEPEPAAVISPQPLAADRRSLDDRDFPSRTDAMGAALSETIGGPVGRHALIGRQGLFTPLRVMFLIGLVFLALGYSTKAACLQSTSTGPADERVANWDNNRAYYELCYSDTVPLYTAELLNLGKFPYKSSWLESDSTGKPKTQYDGRPAVRYMEYPVLTGLYQYASMAVAKTYTALTKILGIPVIAEVVMFFNISAFGLALAWLGVVWATASLAGRRIWDATLVAASPVLIFQIFTNFDALATAFAVGSMLAWARRKPVLAGVLLGLGIAAKLYPVLLLLPLLALGLRTGRLRSVGQTAGTAALTWFLVNLPVLVLFPRGWSEFFRLNARRGDDMDSLYNVVKSFTGWSGFDGNLGFWEPPVVLNTVVAVLFLIACAAITYITLTAPRRPRVAQLAFLVVAAFLLTNKVWSPQFSLWLVPLAVLALPHRRILLAWMTIDALVWIPRMFYLYGDQTRGLPEQPFTITVLLRDLAVLALCALVVWQIYHPERDLVRFGGRVDDPSGGIYENTADAPPAWLPSWLRPRIPAPREPEEVFDADRDRAVPTQHIP
ncbi:glycosyltransferase family 87 protein [Mycobacterium sp.]|uniref:glycosyltransferase family 87 protein n=1 Tax=Mycobacterium sp. TaxID=1785 RepID=UPI003C795223